MILGELNRSRKNHTLTKKAIEQTPFGNQILKTLGTFGHLPKYFIPGAGRSGTTTLYNYMIQHPQISKSITKETRFFDEHIENGLKWYRGFYPKDNCIDATPSYYRNTFALRRIQFTYPKPPKMIMILREPIARFESVWNLGLSKKWHDKSFEEIFDEMSIENAKYDHIRQGIYYKYLEIMFEMFGKENIHVMFIEELKNRPIYEMNEVFKFLGLEKFDIPNLYVNNNHGKFIKRLTDEQRLRLKRIYDPTNTRLEELLDRSLPW